MFIDGLTKQLEESINRNIVECKLVRMEYLQKSRMGINRNIVECK